MFDDGSISFGFIVKDHEGNVLMGWVPVVSSPFKGEVQAIIWAFQLAYQAGFHTLEVKDRQLDSFSWHHENILYANILKSAS